MLTQPDCESDAHDPDQRRSRDNSGPAPLPPPLLPHDDDAKRLAASACHFGEFFTRYDISPPALGGQALLWGHCHHRATGGIDPEQQVLTQMGLDVQPLSGGCCGLAGSWGFEQGKYGISMDCGEQALLPAVRAADSGTLVVANGFSCKTQIEDAGTGRRALHLAEVMQLARNGAAGSSPAGPPEQRATPETAGPAAPGQAGRARRHRGCGRPGRPSR